MFSRIVYIPKFGRDIFSGLEQAAINGIRDAAYNLNIPVMSWQERIITTPIDDCLYISLGGDGTMLTALRAAATEQGSSVFGINFGKLGFLTSVDGSQYITTGPKFTKLITNLITSPWSWREDNRMVIQAKYDNHNDTIIAVNEFLITTPTRRNPLQYEIYVNGNFMTSQSGDGVIISTASGSTAYALSAGGAIMSPHSRAMQIVPLAVHTLTSRPVIVSENDVIEIKADLNQRAKTVQILNDGNLAYTTDDESLDKEFSTTIQKCSFVTIWRPKDWNFFSVLSEKMKW